MIVRPVDLNTDRVGLLTLDTFFVTDRIYAVAATAASFALIESAVTPPLCKYFSLADELGDDRLWQQGFVSAEDGAILGFAAVRYEVWNRHASALHPRRG